MDTFQGKLIRVTEEDIENGIPRSCYACAVAKAVMRETGTHSCVVDAGMILLAGLYYSIPPDVGRFIDRFDGGYTVEPLIFTLRLVRGAK